MMGDTKKKERRTGKFISLFSKGISPKLASSPGLIPRKRRRQ